MPLEEQIQTDLKTAMKSGEKDTVTTLRSLLAQIKDERIKLRTKREMTEDDVIKVVLSAVKKRKEAIELYKQGNREDLVKKEQDELTILQKYLPEQLSEEKITEIIDKIIAEVNASSIKDLGRVMGAAMGQLKGKADGKLVQNLVRQRLTQISQ
ncbi:MAG TPA: GatB/YqeY domain-containing protein [Caldithrix abyssi]|uniref:GatB/YqeY domain-containing protein n=1 Tax=Caldithrix abyssi TaxID=187145 RepID=A0A7V4WVU2_CALAY|nr:GatB/YqeY domain-containing protein [Caldithrix abyssi]